MRLILMFDLPTKTLADKKAYRHFRKFLLEEGYIMHQYSIYSKILLNDTVKDLAVNRVRARAPEKGLVTILSVTEKQFARMIYITGKQSHSVANTDRRVIILGEKDD